MPNTDSTTITRTEPVTLADCTPGTKFMLDPNCRTVGGGLVNFHQTEPHEVEVEQPSGENVLVRGLTNTGVERTQYVDPQFLSRITPPVREWRILRDETGHGFSRGDVVREATPVEGDRGLGGVGDFFVTTALDVSQPLPWRGGYNAFITPSTGEVEEVSQVVTPDSIELGDVYRVVRADGGHGFDIGTLVKVATAHNDGTITTDREGGTRSLYVTTTDTLQQPTWTMGVTAFVNFPGTVEFVSKADTRTPGEVLGDALVENAEAQTAEVAVDPTTITTGQQFWVAVDARSMGNYPVEWEYTEPLLVQSTRNGVDFDGDARVQPVTGGYAQYVNPTFLTRYVEPTPEPVAEELPPPEEVLRLINADDTEAYVSQGAQIASLLQQIETARAAVDAARHDRALWLDRLIQRAHEVADEEEWCEVFDNGMESLGLPPRPEPEPEQETITVRATAEISVVFSDEDFDEWFENKHDESISSSSNSATFTFTREVEAEVTVNENECGCDEDIDWAALLPDYVADNGYDYDISTEGCSND